MQVRQIHLFYFLFSVFFFLRWIWRSQKKIWKAWTPCMLAHSAQGVFFISTVLKMPSAIWFMVHISEICWIDSSASFDRTFKAFHFAKKKYALSISCLVFLYLAHCCCVIFFWKMPYACCCLSPFFYSICLMYFSSFHSWSLEDHFIAFLLFNEFLEWNWFWKGQKSENFERFLIYFPAFNFF